MTATSRFPALFRQRGNTLTGIIIGLIVGLGIAVAVALAITKGASPFSEKAVRAGRPADPAPGQAADPNKPLYGNRDAAREANRELTEKAAPAPVVEADPLGQAIAGMQRAEPKPAAPAAPPAPAAPAAAGGYIYFLQAGAFRDLSDAEATRAKLALLGFEATISERNADGSVLHRVRIGPFKQVEAVHKARAKLHDSGVDVAIVSDQQ